MTFSSFSYKHSSSLTEARVDLQKSIILYYVRYLVVHEIFFAIVIISYAGTPFLLFIYSQYFLCNFSRTLPFNV